MPTAVHAFFDFDGTLIEGDSILYWLRFYYRRRPGRRIFQIASGAALLLHLLRFINSHTYKRVLLWPMSFEDPDHLEALASAFVHEDLVFRFHRPVLERLWTHHYLGHKVVVISASAVFYLKHIQSVLPPCVVLGTELDWRGGYAKLPVYRGGNLRGENKIARLRALGMGDAGRRGFAYADHPYDIPLLRFVDFPVCVCPTLRLRRQALDYEWPIWEWPAAQPPWRRGVNALLLLLFAWAPEADRSEGAHLPGRPQQEGLPSFVRGHVRALRDRVKMRDPQAMEIVFGRKAVEEK